MPDIAEFCPSCGRPVREGNFFSPEEEPGASQPAAEPAKVMPPVEWNDRWVGALAYVTFLPAVVFLFLGQFQRRKFVRFHAFQMIFFCVAMIAIWIGLTIIGFVPGLIFVTFPLHMVVWLGSFILWIILLIKANQGLMFKLPVIGDLAEKQANA